MTTTPPETTAAALPDHEFSAHGHATVLQSNQFMIDYEDNNCLITPNSPNPITDWVHVPISCPTVLDRSIPRISGAAVTVWTGTNPSLAKINKFYVSKGLSTFFKKEGMDYQTQSGFESKRFGEGDFPGDVRGPGGISISLEISFGRPVPHNSRWVRIAHASVEMLNN